MRWSKQFGLLTSILIVLIGTTLFLHGQAYAFNNTFPDQNDTGPNPPNPPNPSVWEINGQTQYVQKTNGTLRVWFPTNTGKITILYGNFCNNVKGDYVESNDKLKSIGNIANNTKITKYDVVPAGGTVVGSSPLYGIKYAANDARCNDPISFTVKGLTTQQNGYFFADLNITYMDQIAGYDGVQNYFRVQSSGSSLIGLPGDFDVAHSNNGGGFQTTQDQRNSNPDNINYRVPFGTDCSINGDKDTFINFYDIDNGGGSGAQKGGPVTIHLLDITAGANVGFSVAATTPGGSFNGAKTVWTPPNTNNNSGFLAFRAKPQHKYRLYIDNVYYNNTIQYSIPYSQIYSLPCPVVATPTLTATATLDKTEYDDTDTAKADADVSVSGGSSTANWSRLVWFDDNGDGIHNDGAANDIYTGSGNGTFAGTTFPQKTKPVAGHSYICTILTLSGAPSGTTINNPANATCADIVRKPSFQVTNGDVNTAMSFCPASGPVPAPVTGIKAFNDGTSGSNTTIGAFAAGLISGFASGGTPLPKNLAFANTGSVNANTTFGGDGAAAVSSVTCVSRDDFTIAASKPVTALPTDPTSGVPLSVSGATTTIYVHGDVYISRDITYTNFNLNDVPNFKIVATGNIYIAPSVANLSGVFKAAGTVYTCATSTGPYTAATILAACNNTKLKVQGALIGHEVRLARTAGSLTIPAETLIFSPEIWIKDLPGTTPNTTPTLQPTYESLTTLPPVL